MKPSPSREEEGPDVLFSPKAAQGLLSPLIMDPAPCTTEAGCGQGSPPRKVQHVLATGGPHRQPGEQEQGQPSTSGQASAAALCSTHELVELNVRGSLYTTTKSTLESQPHSTLAALVNGRLGQPRRDAQVHACFDLHRAGVHASMCLGGPHLGLPDPRPPDGCTGGGPACSTLCTHECMCPGILRGVQHGVPHLLPGHPLLPRPCAVGC